MTSGCGNARNQSVRLRMTDEAASIDYVDQGLSLGASASLASFSQFAARANQNARSLIACLAVSRALSASFRYCSAAAARRYSSAALSVAL